MALQRAVNSLVSNALERVGHGQREQAAHGVVEAGVDQALDPRWLYEAARGVVHEHPVVVSDAALSQLGQTCGDRGRSGGATAVRKPQPVACGARQAALNVALKSLVTRRQHHQRGHDARHGRKCGQRVRHHRAARHHGVLLGSTGTRTLTHPSAGHQGETARR